MIMHNQKVVGGSTNLQLVNPLRVFKHNNGTDLISNGEGVLYLYHDIKNPLWTFDDVHK